MVFIIGAGVSGLSAGIYLRLSGVEVTIADSHTVAGGNLTGWDREGYHIDNCVHWLTGTSEKSEYYEIWQTLGALRNGIYTPESLYTVIHGGERLSLFSDIKRLKEEMLSLSPEDKEKIEELISDVEKIKGFEGLRESGRHTLPIKTLYKYYRMTAGELGAKFKSPLIRKFISSFLTEDFGSLALLFVFAHFTSGNGSLPVGGSRAMAENIKERFLSLGGRLLLGTRVEKINIEKGRAVSVCLEGGEEIEADYVISAAEPKMVFEKLIGRRMPRALERRYRNKRLFLFSSYHAAYVAHCEEIPFKGDLVITVTKKNRARLKSKYIVLREFSHEKGYAPNGETVIEATVFTSLRESRGFIEAYENDREKYRENKKRLSEILDEEIKTALPSLEGRLRLIDFWTPATYKRYTGAEYGSYMSFAFSSRFIPTPLSQTVRGVSNLFLATQWTTVPGGLPSAAKSGKISAEKIIERERRKARGEAAPSISLPQGEG